MDVLFIAGSARDDGMTSRLCDMVGSSISDAAPNAKLMFIRLHEMDIKHCTACGSCSHSGRCVIDDDMHQVYKAVNDSDVIVLAVPIYFSGPSSIIKQAIDRFQCVWATGPRKKSKAVALIAAGGGDSPVFSNTVSITKAFAITIGAEWIGELTVSGTDLLEGIPNDLKEKAQRLGSAVASRILK
ncbi:MAG: flavodoxin family protein [Methanomassiliicoccaceae archaeon]|nr:flavodoxin family protein [Methanomassiliicoccaceae archaeon]